MRIISGTARGIRLTAPEGRDLRPTEDRVKEALFASIGSLQDAIVVDLFAGTGALGLEALSRGATCVRWVEKMPAHGKVIQQNLLAVLKAMGNPPSTDAQLICGDAAQAPRLLPQLAGQCDVILADPPYHPPSGAFGARELLLDAAFAAWAGPRALLVLEHGADVCLPWSPDSPWRLLKTKTFGIRAVSFAKLAVVE